jgi:hypothetical protein
MSTAGLPTPPDLQSLEDKKTAPDRTNSMSQVTIPDPVNVGYDEFGFLYENAEEIGLELGAAATVERRMITVGTGQRLSDCRDCFPSAITRSAAG